MSLMKRIAARAASAAPALIDPKSVKKPKEIFFGFFPFFGDLQKKQKKEKHCAPDRANRYGFYATENEKG